MSSLKLLECWQSSGREEGQVYAGRLKVLPQNRDTKTSPHYHNLPEEAGKTVQPGNTADVVSQTQCYGFMHIYKGGTLALII